MSMVVSFRSRKWKCNILTQRSEQIPFRPVNWTQVVRKEPVTTVLRDPVICTHQLCSSRFAQFISRLNTGFLFLLLKSHNHLTSCCFSKLLDLQSGWHQNSSKYSKQQLTKNLKHHVACQKKFCDKTPDSVLWTMIITPYTRLVNIFSKFDFTGSWRHREVVFNTCTWLVYWEYFLKSKRRESLRSD